MPDDAPNNPSPSPGPPKIDLEPQDILQSIADADPGPVATAPDSTATPALDQPRTVVVPGAVQSHTVTLPGPLQFPPPDPPAEVQSNWMSALGPSYAGLAMQASDPGDFVGYTGMNMAPGDPGDFGEHITAEAAMSLLPSVLLAAVARPAVDYLYKIIDAIPAAIRRPLEKEFGLLLDYGNSLAGAAIKPLTDQTIDKFVGDGSRLPPAVDLPIQGFSQTYESCAETAVATILKSDGEPVALADVDTQSSIYDGTSGQVDMEFRRRGFTCINGPGDMTRLKAFIAAGYPVMVSVGWEGGGGHFAVVTGYDDNTKQLTIQNWDAEGHTTFRGAKPTFDEFDQDWARHLRLMTAVVPQRDPRLEPLMQMGDLRRPTITYPGFTLNDFFVTGDGKVFVEGAYRYVGDKIDVTVKVNFDTSQQTWESRIGGSLSLRQTLAPGWFVECTVTKMSLQGRTDDWTSFKTAPVSIYGALEGPGFELKMGTEQGGFQASFKEDLSKWFAGMGVQLSASVDDQGNYKVSGMISGTW
jgi:hypothetical protein